MTERQLVTIKRITQLLPIEGADKIELAIVDDSWKVVVEKGLHQVNNLIFYFEIDSWIPHELAPFLSKGKEPREYNGVKGEKLRTIRLRKQLSQGLILPLKEVFNIHFDKILESYEKANTSGLRLAYIPTKDSDIFINELFTTKFDLAEILNVQKWEAPIPAQLSGVCKGNFPSFIRKTDQERVQNIWKEYKQKYNDIEFEVTLKMDGTSFTCYYNNGEFGVCSRNLELKEDDNNTYWKVAKSAKLKENLEKLGRNLAIQGEIIGEGIQKNPEKIQGHLLKVFDVYDIDNQKHLSHAERMEILDILDEDGKLFGICQILNSQQYASDIFERAFKLSEFETLDDILQFADGESESAKIREGVVFKSMNYVDGEIISFKVISNEFLEQEKD